MKFILQICILLPAPFIFQGIINRVKSIWAGKKGPSIIQPFNDFRKLLGKGEVISKTTSFIFKLAPSVNISAVIFAFLLLPVVYAGSVISFNGDFILFAYALSLAKFFTIVAALDTGSSFEGMGASREITFSSIVEPAFFIFIGTLALITGQTSFNSIFNLLHTSAGYTIAIKILFSLSIFIMILAEGSRVPVDDPNTHLELTMIHEVMILDNSGPDLAFILYSSWLKMVVFAILIADILIAPAAGIVYSTVLLIFILVVIAAAIGLIESLIARARMSHVPQFLFLMTALSVIAFAAAVFILRGII